MFFNKTKLQNVSNAENVKDAKTASEYLYKKTEEKFLSMRLEMISDLKKAGIPEEEHEKFLQDLYHQVQLEVIKKYKAALNKENTRSQANNR